jgi:peptide/nickel transport system permease protein
MTAIAPEPAAAGLAGGLPAPKARTRRRRRPRPVVALSGLFMLIVVVAALFPGLLAHQNPLAVTLGVPLRGPSATHLLGTDESGRDEFSRLIYGTGASVGIGFGATVIALLAGSVLGLVAGLAGKFADSVVMRAVDCLVAVPDLLLAMMVITIVGTGTWNATIAIGVASIPSYARIIRAQTHQVKVAGYIESARILGLNPVTVAIKHVLPNAFRPLVSVVALRIGGAIGAGAGLSFLGLGVQPPQPEWGAMISTGRDFLADDPLLVLWPALAVTLTVLAVGVLGRALKAHMEGRTA